MIPFVIILTHSGSLLPIMSCNALHSNRYGHIETTAQVADHIAQIREMQTRSKSDYNVGFTEFVPLSFVAKESPMWKLQNERDQNTTQNHRSVTDQKSSDWDSSSSSIRAGPTGAEVVLTHAVSRMMLAGHIDNIQVKASETRDRLFCSCCVFCLTYRL